MQVASGGSTPKKRTSKRAVNRALQSPYSPKGVAAASRKADPKVARKALKAVNRKPVPKVKGPISKAISRQTGTTVGEAVGVLKNTRALVRAGKEKQAQRKLSKALAGGPRAGRPKTARSSVAASRRASKVVGKIERKQSSRRKYGR